MKFNRKKLDKLSLGIVMLFLGIIFTYDGFFDIAKRYISIIVGIIFLTIGISIIKFLYKKEKTI